MKKLTTLLLAAGLVVSSFAGVSAVSSQAFAGEFKPNAQFINQYTWGTAGSAFTNQDDNFVPQFRLRLGFDYIAGESLSGTFLFEVGVESYGTTGKSQLDQSINGKDGYDVRLAYVDWMVPTTDVSVRMGFQPIALPSFAFASPVLDGRGAGITVSSPINENINVAALWTRVEFEEYAENNDGNDPFRNGQHSNEYDAFAVIADFNYDGFRIAPWALFATKGDDIDNINSDNLFPTGFEEWDATVWMIGAGFELSMFDPFLFALDAYYSDVDLNYKGSSVETKDQDMKGYYVGASASYETMYGTPTLKAWYASGNDKNDGGLANDFGFGQPFSLAPAFNATSIMFDDNVMDTDGYGQRNFTPAGTWGIVLEWANFSFIDKLTHTARIAYIEGTNDKDSVSNWSTFGFYNNLQYLTTEDNVVEVNFNSTYEIYKNFHAHLELGWLTADFGRRGGNKITDTRVNDALGNYVNGGLGKDADDDIFRSALSFVYEF